MSRTVALALACSALQEAAALETEAEQVQPREPSDPSGQDDAAQLAEDQREALRKAAAGRVLDAARALRANYALIDTSEPDPKSFRFAVDVQGLPEVQRIVDAMTAEIKRLRKLGGEPEDAPLVLPAEATVVPVTIGFGPAVAPSNTAPSDGPAEPVPRPPITAAPPVEPSESDTRPGVVPAPESAPVPAPGAVEG